MFFKYIHSECFENVEVPNITESDEIFLWGAGKVGSVVAHALLQRGFDFIAFVDSARDKQGKSYYGHNIISPEELYENHKNALVIASCAFPTVLDIMKKNGIDRAYSPVFLLKEFDFAGYEGDLTIEFARRITENALRNYALYYGTGFLIERLFFNITDKCSLKCKNCDSYIPYYKNPKNDSLETIIMSYNRIMDVCKIVDTVDIFGGEPLVHPNISQITEFFVKDGRCRQVTIITNGTIIPSSELLMILKSPKCIVRISDYGMISSKKEQLIRLLEKEQIRYEVTNYEYWEKIPLIQETQETQEQLDAKYAACTANLFYVKNGKLFHCNFVTGLSTLEEELIPDFYKNYVDLLDVDIESVHKKIKKSVDRLHSRKHIDACKYCPGSHCIHFEDKQPVAEQTGGILPIENLFKDGKRLCISQI